MAQKIVLLIEDDQDIRLTLKDILEDEGYLVLEASNGQEGLRALELGARPDLIFLDAMMPVKNGSAFRADQLENTLWAKIPTIVMSAARDIESQPGLNTTDHILKKPVDLDELLGLAHRYLN